MNNLIVFYFLALAAFLGAVGAAIGLYLKEIGYPLVVTLLIGIGIPCAFLTFGVILFYLKNGG
jgi:hypothetical protein